MADDIEVWEITIPGTIYVWVRDPREASGYRQQKVGGASKRLRISSEDRAFNEEQIPEENGHLNPFRNGSLVQHTEGRVEGLTNESLRELLELEESAFREAVAAIDSELTARRLDALTKDEGRVWQYDIIHEHVVNNWRAGGTQRTVEEMLAESDTRGTLLYG